MNASSNVPALAASLLFLFTVSNAMSQSPPLTNLQWNYTNYYTDVHPESITNDIKWEWGKPVGGYALSIAVTNKDIVAGEQIALFASRKNVSNSNLFVTETTPLFIYYITVKHPNGEVVPMSTAGKVAYDADKSTIDEIDSPMLRPGEKTLDTIPLRDLYDLKPGAYRVSVFIHVPVVTGSSVRGGTLDSNEIEIVVKARQ